MSGAHTEGPLAAVDQWIIPAAHTDRKIGGSTDKAKDFATYAHIIATVQSKYHDEKANIRRLVACWNAFDGVPTEKIEGKSAAEYVANESYLTGLIPIPGRGMELGLSGDACQLLADSFAGQFKGSGGVNFIEVQMHHKDMGPFTVTIQRQEGETPAQQKAAALRELAAARALLKEVSGNDPYIVPQTMCADLARRVRAFVTGAAA